MSQNTCERCRLSHSHALAPRRRGSLSAQSRRSTSRSLVDTIHATTSTPITRFQPPCAHPSRRPCSSIAPIPLPARNSIIALRPAAPNLPRLRALTLLGRRPPLSTGRLSSFPVGSVPAAAPSEVGWDDKGEEDAGDHSQISRFDFVRYDAPPKEECR
jgi:hypothetical protein